MNTGLFSGVLVSLSCQTTRKVVDCLTKRPGDKQFWSSRQGGRCCDLETRPIIGRTSDRAQKVTNLDLKAHRPESL